MKPRIRAADFDRTFTGAEHGISYDTGEAGPRTGTPNIGLPVMDRYELAHQLRDAHRNGALRLVALTGYGQERDRELSRRAGVDVQLVEPVDFDTGRAA